MGSWSSNPHPASGVVDSSTALPDAPSPTGRGNKGRKPASFPLLNDSTTPMDSRLQPFGQSSQERLTVVRAEVFSCTYFNSPTRSESKPVSRAKKPSEVAKLLCKR